MRYIFLTFALAITSLATLSPLHSRDVVIKDVENIKGIHQDKDQLFGLFIEFLREYVNGPQGMYAQEFRDRGLDIQGWVGDGDFRYWESTEKGLSEHRWGGYNTKGSLYLSLMSEGDRNGNAGQMVYYDDTTKLDIYIYARRDKENSDLQVNIYDNFDRTKLLETQTFTLSSEWEKYEFTSRQFEGYNQLYIEFASTGNGEIWIDEASCMPDNNFIGVRREYYDFYKAYKPGNLRYPGGEFADSYVNFLDNSTGPIDQRRAPAFVDGMQRMDWGYVEYFNFCDSLDIRPYIVLNSNKDLPDVALETVQFCTGDTTTQGGKLRYELTGRAEPYDVAWYEIGNENWESAKDHAEEFRDIYAQVKPFAGDAVFIANGNHWVGMPWFDTLYSVNGGNMENYGWHPVSVIPDFSKYPESQIKYAYMAETFLARRDIDLHVEHMKEKGIDDVDLSLSEWWVMMNDAYRTGEEHWLNDVSLLSSSVCTAIYEAMFCSVLLDYPNVLTMGSRTQGIGGIRRGEDSLGNRVIYPSTNFIMNNMVKKNSGPVVHDPTIEQEWYQTNHYDNDWTFFNIPYCDVVLTSDESNYYLSIINRDTSSAANIIFQDSGETSRTAKIIQTDTKDFFAYSTFDNPYILNFIEKEVNISEISIEPNSYAVVIIPLPNKSVESDERIFSVYPNPTDDLIIIERPDLHYARFGLFDTNGRMVISESGSFLNRSIDLSGISPGIYILRDLESGFTQKIVKR